MAGKRVKVGSLLRSKEGTGVYFKANVDFSLKKGDLMSVATKKEQLDSLEKAVAAGKLPVESAAKIRDIVESIPDFVFAEVFYTAKV
jgi:hypothetical protein